MTAGTRGSGDDALMTTAEEMALAASWVREAAQEHASDGFDVPIGTMIETPAAALTAERVAGEAAFFSFGSQRPDPVDARPVTRRRGRLGARAYQDHDLLPDDPLQTIHGSTVGRLVRMAVAEGRRARTDLEVGICGEHGGDPASITFFHDVGLDNVLLAVPVAPGTARRGPRRAGRSLEGAAHRTTRN